MKNIHLQILIAGTLLFTSCSETKTTSTQSTETNAKEEILGQFPEIPRDEIVAESDSLSQKVYTELQNRYKAQLSKLNSLTKANGAQLVITFLTPEVGNSLTQINKEGKGLIEGYCKELNIPYFDLTTKIADMDPAVITQIPKDGHWSKEGAKVVANELAPIIKQFGNVKSSATFAQKPEVWGDLTPNTDEISDGGKGLPYRVKSNAQGFRMDTDLATTKTKQRILLMGDSEFYFPFLDNKFTGSAILQDMFPDKEIINSAMWGYSIDDYISLYNEKAKFAEPDVIIVEANGNDILDLYFSHRNRFSRVKQPKKPTALEEQYYKAKFQK
ncbi:hypothetical protein [Flectobacillus major]|uniref:hypothetical protein n=1 Tax=Flectobacillus major TaxID=103 RepID=UPI00040D945A|nr:hypothetical protein [Flectobacillus major]